MLLYTAKVYRTYQDTRKHIPLSLGLYHSGQDGLLLYRNIHDASPYSSNVFSVVAITVGAFPPASSIREAAGRLTRASGKHSGLANGTLSITENGTPQCTAYLSPPITPSAVPPGTARGIIAAARRGGSQGTVVISTVLALPPLAAPHNSDRRRNLDTRPLRKDCANLF